MDAHTRKWATVALERMLAIKGTGNPIHGNYSNIASQEDASAVGGRGLISAPTGTNTQSVRTAEDVSVRAG